MKSLCLFLGLSLLAISAAHSQTTTVTVDANNNVMNSANKNLNIITATGQSFFMGRQLGSGYTYGTGIFRAVTDNPYGDYNWFYEGVRNNTQTFAVRADGNMKLGPGPQGSYASNSYSVISLSNPVNGGLLDFYKGNTMAALVSGDGNGLNLLANTGSGIHFFTNNTESMTLSTNGNVSVNNGNLFFAGGNSALQQDQYGSIELGSSTASASYPYLDMHFGGQSAQQDFNVRLMNNDNNQLQFQTAANGAVMTIRGPRVGIGTAQPDQALTVNGTIHATKVLVEATVPTPDYVFEKGYKLRSLKEVEAYIKANKHLPEVASAKEMAAKGIDMTELNMKLLQKMEEMTLYMLKQDQRINRQEKYIKALKKDVKVFKANK